MYTDFTIKARCLDPLAAENVLLEHSAHYKGLDTQTDTFYETEIGKLKHRQGTIENVLIHYNRIPGAEAKRTEVFLYHKNPDREFLQHYCNAKKVIAKVEKQRKIFFIENVKFHIDHLADAGDFIEIEAIDLDGSLGKKVLQKQCNYYKELLQIKDVDLINESYIDLQLNTTNK